MPSLEHRDHENFEKKKINIIFPVYNSDSSLILFEIKRIKNNTKKMQANAFSRMLLTNYFIKHYFENIFSTDIKMKLSVSFFFPKFRKNRPLSKFSSCHFKIFFQKLFFEDTIKEKQLINLIHWLSL